MKITLDLSDAEVSELYGALHDNVTRRAREHEALPISQTDREWSAANTLWKKFIEAKKEQTP